MARDYSRVLQVPSPTDGSLKRFILKLFEDSVISSLELTIGVFTEVSVNGVTAATPENDEEAKNRTFSAVKSDIETAFEGTTETSVSTQKIEFHGKSGEFCTFERVRTVPMEILSNARTTTIHYYPVPDYRVAEFYFDGGRVPEANKFNTALSQFIRPAPGADAGDGGPDGLNAVLSRMGSVTAGMMEDLSKSQLAQEERMTALIERQSEELEAQKLKLNETHQEQLGALRKRGEELDTREAEMDNASTRSTRRKLRGAITDALKENQKAEIIPESARKVRTPILWLAGLGILVAIVFSGWAFWGISTIPDNLTGAALNWYLISLLLRGSLGIFASIAIALHLLRYLRNIEAEAGRRALVLEQNLFDIDRASWVVETVMELKEEQGMTSVPGPWLEGVTRGLFQHNKDDEVERGPVDALVDLMGTGMALKLNNGDSEVSFDSKASKAAAKLQKKGSSDSST